jgi:hypothetical protein
MSCTNTFWKYRPKTCFFSLPYQAENAIFAVSLG